MMHQIQYYHRVVGLRGLFSALRGKAAKRPNLLEMAPPDIAFPFYLRVPSSDVYVYEQIFVGEEYRFEVRESPRTIVDAGANIGLASIYFANRFPAARIVAVEPEDGNFRMLQMNSRPYANIEPVRAALWHENRTLDLVDPDLGNWGFMTRAGSAEAAGGTIVHPVRGMSIESLMEQQGLGHIDILKLDIEGAEREIFAHCSGWLDKVDALIVELHERMKPGCNRSFYSGTAGFGDEWWQGENVYLARDKACLLPPAFSRAIPGR